MTTTPHSLNSLTPNNHVVHVLDDDLSIRDSLKLLLSAKGYFVLSHATAESLFSSELPEVPACLLLDHHLEGGVTGVQVYHEMRERGWIMPTIFLTAHWSTQSIVGAMRDGADDFITKPFEPEALVKAVSLALKRDSIRREVEGEIYEISKRVATLTKRERNIVSMVVGGLLNKEVAHQLGLAVITIKIHRANAIRKLGAGNAVDLARIATLGDIPHWPNGLPEMDS
ncbi:MAG: response regulator [Luteolibacter sp.]